MKDDKNIKPQAIVLVPDFSASQDEIDTVWTTFHFVLIGQQLTAHGPRTRILFGPLSKLLNTANL